MASYTWNGSVSTSWATAANWTPAGPPAAGDSVFIPETATRNLLTNLDRTGDTLGAGLHLATFRIQKDSTVAVGASGAELKITCDKLIHLGKETLYYNSDTGTGGTVTAQTFIQSNNLVDAVVLGGDTGYTRIFMSRGGASYVATGTTRLYMSSVRFQGDAKMTVAGTSSPFSEVWLSGGTLTTSSNITTCYAFSGTMTINGAAALGSLIQTGGNIFYNSTGTLGSGVLCDGRLDSTANTSAKTFTLIWTFPPHEFVYQETLTTFTTFVNWGDQS